MEQNKLLYNLSASQIMAYHQNSYPCFFLDVVTEVKPGQYAKGYKNFSVNEWGLLAYEDVPTTLVCEACEQLFLMTFLTLEENVNRKTSTISINAEYLSLVPVGSQLDIESTLRSSKRGLAIGESRGYVKGELVCKFGFVVNIPDIMNSFIPKK